MSYGSTAYDSYVRIRAESGVRIFPLWEDLPHVRRLAWEAAAQAVAMAIVPSLMTPEIDGIDELDDLDEIENGSTSSAAINFSECGVLPSEH